MIGAIIAAVASIGVVVIAAYLFRKLGRGSADDGPDGATASHAGAMLAALFLVAFAIAVVVPWTNADSARQNTYTESQAVVEAYWSAAQLPALARTRVQAGLADYLQLVAGREWQLQAVGRLSPAGWALLDGLHRQVAGLRVTSSTGQNAQANLLDELNQVAAARRQRAADAATSLPAGLLLFTVASGFVVMIFPFLAGARPYGMTVLPLLAMAVLLGIGIYVPFDIAHVFSGGLAVRPTAYVSALQEIQRIGGGG